MESTPLLYQTLMQVLGCHQNWLDIRHQKTLAWMINGLILSGKICLGEWALYVQGRAQYLQSIIRRFRRFLDNDRIDVQALYAPLFVQALKGWDRTTIYVALDTSMLWNTYCLVRLSLIYRGRAIPMVWRVFEHGSATIAYDDYKALLDEAARILFPLNCQIIFLADRGFADTDLMQHLLDLNWHFRIPVCRQAGASKKTSIFIGPESVDVKSIRFAWHLDDVSFGTTCKSHTKNSAIFIWPLDAPR